MKKYKYIFHFVSGQSYVLTTPKSIDLVTLTSRPWFFINNGNDPSYCNNGGVTFNVDNIEFIEVIVFDEE